MLDPETKQRPEDQRHRAEPEDLRRSPGLYFVPVNDRRSSRRGRPSKEAVENQDGGNYVLQVAADQGSSSVGHVSPAACRS